MGVDMLWRLVLARFTNKTNDGKCQNRLDVNLRGLTPFKRCPSVRWVIGPLIRLFRPTIYHCAFGKPANQLGSLRRMSGFDRIWAMSRRRSSGEAESTAELQRLRREDGMAVVPTNL